MRAFLFAALVLAVSLPAPADELADLAQAAKANFHPAAAADLEAAGEALLSAKTELEKFLARDPQQAAPWGAYLQFELLDEELERGVEADPTVIAREVLGRARADREGLELPEFSRYRAALDEYLLTLWAVREPPTREEFGARLEALTSMLAQHESQPTAELGAGIAEHLAWLRAKRQAGPLLAAARSRFDKPNAWLCGSALVLSTWSREKVERDSPIQEYEDDQYTFGVSHVSGYAAQFPVAAPDGEARLEVRFSGTLTTRTTTVQDKVRVNSRGVAPMTARKGVTLTDAGLVGDPACAHACYNNCVECISTTIKGPVADALVRKIAGGYIDRNESEIEADAARGAERKFSRQFDEDVEEELIEGNRNLREKFRNPLLRQDLYPRKFVYRSTDESIEAMLVSDRLGGPAAAGPPPDLAAGWDFGVRLHESFVNNLGHTVMAGRLYSVEDVETLVRKTMKRYGMPVEADEEKPSEEVPPGDVGIEFDYVQPLEVRFAENTATVIVHGRRYVYENRAYPPMNIIVRYRLENDAGKLRATLVGEPEYTPPPGVGGLQVIALRRILRSQINPRIDREIVQGEVHLPDTNNVDEVGALDFHEVAAANGWLTISLRRRNRESNALRP